MPDVQKVSIALTGEQLAALKAAVETGEYATTSEAVREALREWQWKREFREMVNKKEIERLKKAWDEGVASGRAEPMDFDATLAEARRRLKKATEAEEVSK
jgi:antitoxin ParD1/3/4